MSMETSEILEKDLYQEVRKVCDKKGDEGVVVLDPALQLISNKFVEKYPRFYNLKEVLLIARTYATGYLAGQVKDSIEAMTKP